MLNINDFILYLPMKGNLTDYSRNGYTATNNGATLTTGVRGVSNTAYSFNGSSQYITFTSTVQQAIATALSSSASLSYTIYPTTVKTAGIVDGYYASAQNSWLSQLGNDSKIYFGLYDGVTSKGLNSALTYSTNTWTYAVNNMSSSTAYEGYRDITTITTSTFTAGIKTNSTGVVNIGRRGDGVQYFSGKITNIIALDRPVTKLEQKYIKKFGNIKRVA